MGASVSAEQEGASDGGCSRAAPVVTGAGDGGSSQVCKKVATLSRTRSATLAHQLVRSGALGVNRRRWWARAADAGLAHETLSPQLGHSCPLALARAPSPQPPTGPLVPPAARRRRWRRRCCSWRDGGRSVPSSTPAAALAPSFWRPASSPAASPPASVAGPSATEEARGGVPGAGEGGGEGCRDS